MKPAARVPRLAATGLAACGLIAAGALWAQAASRSIWDGVYTDAQAQRGAAEYTSHCVDCHLDNFAGDGGDIPALVGKSFLNNWDGLALAELFDRIHTSMPQSDPGSLSVQQAIDLTAYLLSVNKVPSGSQELPHDLPSLQKIQFDAKKPSH